MRPRRVLVVGPRAPLGNVVTAVLRRRGDLDVSEATGEIAQHAALVGTLIDARIDTVVHTGLIRWGRELEVDVIGTMRLTAAIADPAAAVRTVAVASSTAAYPSSSRAPALRREREVVESDADTTAARVIEAESYVRRLADAHPHISVSILRCADLAGTAPGGPLTELLRARVAPALLGFDPLVQLLHVDDAAAALEHAVIRGLAGTYNVAASEPLRWRHAARLAQRPIREIPAIQPWITPLARVLGVQPISADVADVLRFGRCVDTSLIAGTGLSLRRTTADCVRLEARAGRCGTVVR